MLKGLNVKYVDQLDERPIESASFRLFYNVNVNIKNVILSNSEGWGSAISVDQSTITFNKKELQEFIKILQNMEQQL